MSEHDRTNIIIEWWPLIAAIAVFLVAWGVLQAQVSWTKDEVKSVQAKADNHETRISTYEGKMDQMIELQREILKRIR